MKRVSGIYMNINYLTIIYYQIKNKKTNTYLGLDI